MDELDGLKKHGCLVSPNERDGAHLLMAHRKCAAGQPWGSPIAGRCCAASLLLTKEFADQN